MRARLRLNELATEKGMSRTELHKKSDVAYTTVRTIFNDPYADATIITLNRLAQVLGVETKDLIEDVSEEQYNTEHAKILLEQQTRKNRKDKAPRKRS